MAKGVHKGELSRQRLLAMRERGQGLTAELEVNAAGDRGHTNGFANTPANGHANGVATNGYPAGTAANGHVQTNDMNGSSAFAQGHTPIAYPANARAANTTSAGY